ncbi:hypothetical protein KA517_04650, partial [Candidatus Gracilibacteria bacterium]|nr:hypothetical protein [Candidatus Gracilibacteria bacterium]
QVLNMLEDAYREDVTALGSLIVNRDGAERMIINCLVHPTLKYLILFAEEGLTFSPSTNLLVALMQGYQTDKNGNYINGGRAASAHYPNISIKLLETFRNTITVIPLFTHKSKFSNQIIADYLAWLQPKVDQNLFATIQKINQKDKIYYDSLKEVLTLIKDLPMAEKTVIELDVKEFQQLQPPKIAIDAPEKTFPTPFEVRASGKNIVLSIAIDGQKLVLEGPDDFLLGYSLMKTLGPKKDLLSPQQQLLLGAELGLVRAQIEDNIEVPHLTTPIQNSFPEAQAPLQSRVFLQTDKKYYYRIGIDGSTISLMCLAYDICEAVFDLRSTSFTALIEKLVEMNRFEAYEMDILHRIDVGSQLARAHTAAKLGYLFMQDFPNLFKINTTELPLLIADSDTFLTTHKSLLQQLYTRGLTEEHGDPWKGLARSASVLAVYRKMDQALALLPAVYQQGDQTTVEMREAYKQQLLRYDHDGSYSYGERTRAFFGFDQLEQAAAALQRNPTQAVIVQRFDPSADMSSSINPITGKMEFSHDPCLTHDIFWINNQKLFSFHIARAHNTVNAYPENIFGLYDAYTTTIADTLAISTGDMFMLSSRANILLLTEEQRTKKLLAEPSKPTELTDTTSGPYLLGENISPPTDNYGVAYQHHSLTANRKTPEHPWLTRMENYRDQNIIKKAITYLYEKGLSHNNPVLSTYHANDDDPQSDQLVFLQINVFGKKIHATAVCTNRSLSQRENDIQLLNYIATLFSDQLEVPLGDLSLFYTAYTQSLLGSSLTLR